jgi:two-component system nitrate/nitrite response regulator NarL
VVIAATEPLFRDGLARTIRRDPGLQLVAELEGGSAILEAIRRLVPDVAVVDAGPETLKVVQALAQSRLGTRIVVLTANVRPDIAFEAVAAGAHGYLSKRVNADIVCDAIRRVAAGGVVLCEEAQTVVAGEIRLRRANEHALLAPRELDVLRLAADGLNNGEIGRRLHIAPSTVKSHLTRVFQQLGVRDRTRAAVEATRRGLLD